MSDQVEVLERDQVRAIHETTRPIVESAESIVVDDQASFNTAMEGVERCKVAMRRIEAIFGPARQKAHGAWKAICDAIGGLTKPLEVAAQTYNRKAYAWRAEEKKRLAAAEKLRQEEERKRIEAENVEIAVDLDSAGLKAAADRVLDQPVTVAPRAIEVPKAETAKVTFRENWKFEITDASALPREYLMPDEVKIGRIVKAMKGETAIPGVRVWDAGSAVVK